MKAWLVAFAGMCAAAPAAADGVADKVTTKAGECRRDAATLRSEAGVCREALAAGKTCAGVKIGGDRRLPPDEADRVAASFDANAARLDEAVPGLKKLDDLVASDQDGIRSIGFKTTVEQLDAWEKMGKARRCALIKGTIDAVMTEVFVGAAEGAKSLTPAKARELNKHWRKVLGRFPALKRAATEAGVFALVTKIGKMSKTDEKTLEQFANAVMVLKSKAFDLAPCPESDRGPQDYEKWVNAVADVAGSLVPDRRARLASFAVRLANSGVHAWGEAALISSEVERLDQLTDEQHRALEKLTALLKKHVDQRAKLLAKVAPCQLP